MHRKQIRKSFANVLQLNALRMDIKKGVDVKMTTLILTN